MYAKYCKLRDDKGITDYRVATDTGISASTISEWRTQGNPSFDSLVKLSNYFGVSLDYWRGGENEQ